MPRLLFAATIACAALLAPQTVAQFGGTGGRSGQGSGGQGSGGPGSGGQGSGWQGGQWPGGQSPGGQGTGQWPNPGVGGLPAGSSGIWGSGPQIRFGATQAGTPSLQSSGGDVRGFPLLTGPQSGRYPNFPGYAEGQVPGEGALIPPVGALRPSGLWPAWLTPGQDQPAQTDSAILVRNSERVWYRAADESVFIPLPYFDKIRRMAAGAGVQVRTDNGGFNVIMHDGATIRADGRTNLEVRILSDAVAEFEVIDLGSLWVASKSRLLRLWLPDDSAVEAMGGRLWLARDAQRVVVRNYGPEPVKIRSQLGDRDLPRNQEVAILATPMPALRPALTLATQGSIGVRGEGRRLLVEGGTDGGAVDWLGARVRISAGSTGVLDAMAGSTFPDYRGNSPASQSARERGTTR